MQHEGSPTPGAIVWIRSQRWRVDRAEHDRHLLRLDVSNRQRRLTVLVPFDRPVATGLATRARRLRRQRGLARVAGIIADAWSARSVTAARRAGIEMFAHQLEPALAVIGGARRLLLADEVGLGKTIQAGLVIAELSRRAGTVRALVIAPPSLRPQWAQELRERFGLATASADRHGLADAAGHHRRGTEAWESSQIWIASADYLKQPHVLAAMPRTPWDVVVVDEAHDAAGDSVRREACDAIAKHARHVLLLTATPHSGDEQRFARLADLGRLPTIDDPPLVFRRTRAGLGLRMTRRARWISLRLSPQEGALLDALAAFERAALKAAGDRRRAGALLVLAVLRKRALSTVSALQMSLVRRLQWLDGDVTATDGWQQPSLWENEDNGEDADERVGLTGQTGLSPEVERRWIARLQTLAHAARMHDTKLAWLRGVVLRSSEPVVVFTEFRHSLVPIVHALSRHRVVAELNGSMSAHERSTALARFLGGAASVLAATDVAGQGLNLQHRARWIINVELPWNPARLEQRIGRVDRIGQTQAVHASILVARHPAESGLLASLARRTLGARRALGDDTLLDLAPPSELVVATTLLGGTAYEERPPSTSVPLATSWRRHARAVALDVVRRRRLAARWREPRDVGHRPGVAGWCDRFGTDNHLTRAIAVLTVPILDETGVEIERAVVALELHAASPGAALAILSSPASRVIVARHLQSRCDRLCRWLTVRRARLAAIDRAIADNVAAGERQQAAAPALFQSEYVTHTAGASRLRRDAAAGVGAGTPSIEVVLTCGTTRCRIDRSNRSRA